MASNTNVKYKCPFCTDRMTRAELVAHVQDEHEDELPKDFTAFRYVFNYVNRKPLTYHGKCTECGGPTPWDEVKGRYNRQCGKKACHDSFVAKFEENMLRTTGHTRMSDTAEGQVKMLANRKISGEYKFKDGGVKTYTGSYELKALEFMDKVMDIQSDDILSPGPILNYKLKDGREFMYITDFYYQPYNLVIEVKDGGNNPNRRNMPEYREKQIAKEQYIIKNTDFNYLRLTDNNLGQLIRVFADLKMQMVDNGGTKRVIHVNEAKEVVNESWIKNDKDILYNKEAFENGDINLCFVTGHIGSGKSTLAHGKESDEIEVYELDDLQWPWKFSDDNLKKYGDLIWSFFNGVGKKYRIPYRIEKDGKLCGLTWDDEDQWFVDNGFKDELGDDCYNSFYESVTSTFVDYAIKYAKSHKNKKYILEGIQLFLFIDPAKLKDYAVYIKGTSVLISTIRGVKRDSMGKDLKAIADNIDTFVRRIVASMGKTGFEAKINSFRKYFGNKPETVLESLSWKESDDKIKSVKKIYYGLTEKESKQDSLRYKGNGSNKAVNTTLDGLIRFVKDNNMTDLITKYVVLNPSQFNIDTNVMYDDEYDMISVKTPFEFNISDVKDLSVNESYIEEADTKLFKNVIDDPEITGVYPFRSSDGIYNVNVTIKGFNKYLRGRSEMLIIDKDKVFLNKNSEGYSIPGGGWEENEDHNLSAIRETNEEAKIKVKNVSYVSKYAALFDPKDWVKEKINKENWWYGEYIELYIGEYDGTFKGNVEKIDQQKDMEEKGKFYNIKDVYKDLIPQHQKALSDFVNESYVEEASFQNYKLLDLKSNKSKVLSYLKNSSQTRNYADDIVNNYNGEIALYNDAMIGRIFVGDKKDKGFITDFSIDEEHRGNKLGSRMIDDAINKYHGYDLLVDKTNKLAIDMYKRRGFVIDRTEGNQYYMKLPSAVIEAISVDDTYHPVYIIAASYKSPLEKPIELVTGSKFAHACIALDSSFKRMYSFNGDHNKTLAHKFLGGFSAESIDLYKSNDPEALFRVHVVFLKDNDYYTLEKKIKEYEFNKTHTQYNFLGLLDVPLGKKVTSDDEKMFCSQFVDYMFKFIDVDLTNKSSNLVTPADISRIRNKRVYKIFDGIVRNFNPKSLAGKIKGLLGKAEYIKESTDELEYVDLVEEEMRESINKAVDEMMAAASYAPVVGLRDCEAYVVNYDQNRVFDKDSDFAVMDGGQKTIIRVDKDTKKLVKESFNPEYVQHTYAYKIGTLEEVSKVLAPYLDKEVDKNFIYETFFHKKLYTHDQLATEAAYNENIEVHMFKEHIFNPCSTFIKNCDKHLDTILKEASDISEIDTLIEEVYNG